MALVPFSNVLAVSENTANKAKLFMSKSKESRRIHISHLPHDITKPDLMGALQCKMRVLRKSLIEGQTRKRLADDVIIAVDDVIDLTIVSTGSQPFAFAEINTDEMATELTLDHTPYEFVHPPTGQVNLIKLRVRRPVNYVPMTGLDARKIIVLGLTRPDEMADTFKALLEHFGDMERFAVIPNQGYYVEYGAPAAAAEAMKELNGCTEIGGRVLVVQLATDAMRAWLRARGLPVTGIDDGAAEEGSIFAPDPLRDLTQDVLNMKLSLTQVLNNFVHSQPHLRNMWPVLRPTRILILMNMFDPEEVLYSNDGGAGGEQQRRRRQRAGSGGAGGGGDDDVDGVAETDHVRDLREEIEDECEKYGRVRNFYMMTEMPRPPTKEDVMREIQRERKEEMEFFDKHSGDDNSNDDDGDNEDVNTHSSTVAPAELQKRLDTIMFKWYEKRHHPVFGDVAIGKVFVEYETVEEAEAAQRAIAGRLFNGRTIITSFLFEDILYPPDDEGEDQEEGDGTGFVGEKNQPEGGGEGNKKDGDDDDDDAGPGFDEGGGGAEDLD